MNFGYLILIGIIGLFSWLVSSKLKSKFEFYSKVQLRNGMSGAEIAEKMLADNGIRDVKVISTPGRLTDHYNPSDKTVNLSEAVYNVFIMRTFDNIMRKIKGQDWIDKKNKLAIINTNKLIGL